MVIGAAMAALAMALGGWLVPIGVGLAAWGLSILRLGRAAQRTHAALQALTRGQLEAAEAHLDAIPARAAKRGSVKRAVSYQRAVIAFYRGDAATATRLLDGAISKRTALATYGHEQMQRALALSLRALAGASLSETARARSDAAEVLASPYATPEAIARVHIAEAVALARGSGSSDALAAHLRAHGAFMLEHALPRERVLARAIRTMVRTRTRSIYREAAKPEGESEGARDVLGAWVASVAPEAAAFHEPSRLAERSEMTVVPEPTADAKRAIAYARAPAKPALNKRVAFVVGLWVTLIVAFLAIWQFLTPVPSTHGRHHAPPPPPPSDTWSSWLSPLVACAIVGAVVVIQIRRLRRFERELFAAIRALASADPQTAYPILDRLDRGPGLIAAQSSWVRARHFEEHARFADALALCDRALASIHAQPYGMRTTAALFLTPSVLGLRATVLAALGREAEANAELAVIATQHAAFAHRSVYELRARLLSAVRRGDLDAARAIARERTPELPIPLRDETLADLVLATAPHGASRDEQERVDGDIRDDVTTRTWLETVAPGLCEDLARRVGATNMRVAPQEEEAVAEAAYEDEGVAARATVSSSS
jgi:hypothetical protein